MESFLKVLMTVCVSLFVAVWVILLTSGKVGAIIAIASVPLVGLGLVLWVDTIFEDII